MVCRSVVCLQPWVTSTLLTDSLLPESSSFTLVDSLHSTTFMAIFATLLVSAIALKFHDNGNVPASIKVNYYGSRIVVSLYVIINVVFILLAI